MSKVSKKINRKLFFFVFLFLVMSICTITAYSPTHYRPIHINNTGGSEQTYYQVSLNITYDSDMNNDFSDIRVKNETSGEFVPYWIENKVDGSWCKIWFNATHIPANSWCNDTYYLYYGDASASDESNGDATFLFFDDMETEIGYIDTDMYNLTHFSAGTQVIDNGNSGEYDYHIREFSNILYEPNDIGKEYKLAYSGYPSSESDSECCLAYSSDGINWTKMGQMDASVNSGHQQEDFYILKVDGTYYIYAEEDNNRIRLFTNTEWTQNGWTDEGVLTGDGWASPIVWKEGENDWRMIYECLPSETICYATSSDGKNWTPSSDNPVMSPSGGWEGTQCLVPEDLWKSGSTYYMTYHCCGTSDNRWGIATSTDLVNWTRYEENPIEPVEGDSHSWVNAQLIHNVSDILELISDSILYTCKQSPDTQGIWRNVPQSFSSGNWVEDPTYTGGSIYRDSLHKIGSYSLKHTRDSGTSAFFRPVGTINSNIAIEFYRRSTATDKQVSLILNQGQSHSGTKQVTTIVFYEDGYIKYYDDAWHNIMPYSANTWYRIKLCNFDFSAHTFDIYIDDMDTPKVTGASFRNALSYFDNFEIVVGNFEGAVSYIDTLFIRKYADPEPSALLGAEQSIGGECTAPTISSLTNSTPTTNSVTITWTTNQSADNRVKYSKNSDLSNPLWSSWDNDTTSISITLTGLDPNTVYYYQAWSYNGTNSSCYTTKPTSGPYNNFTTQQQTSGECTNPEISSLTVSDITANSAVISWNTNQSSDNRVKYSKYSDLSNYSWSSWNNDTTSVSIILSGLESNTTYYYQVWSYNGTNSSCYTTKPSSQPYENFTTMSGSESSESHDIISIKEWLSESQVTYELIFILIIVVLSVLIIRVFLFGGITEEEIIMAVKFIILTVIVLIIGVAIIQNLEGL